MRQNSSGRVRSFDEVDDAAGGTRTVNRIEEHYLDVDNEDIVGAIKEYAKRVLRERLDRYHNPHGVFDRFKNRVGYSKALVAKYGIMVLAARRRMDKENPKSLLSQLEKRLAKHVLDVIRKLRLPESVYTPWMSILSYPSSKIGGCHPWIMRFRESLGESAVESAEQVRSFIDVQRRIIVRRVSESSGSGVKEFRRVIERLQRIHFWSEKDELEEDEDLELANMVVDVFCPHIKKHRALKDIAGCPSVRSYLDPGRFRKLMLLGYILFDDILGSGRELRKIKVKEGVR